MLRQWNQRSDEPENQELVCSGCGAEGIKTRHCPTCGKRIADGFEPLDMIRSSYRLQGRSLSDTHIEQVENLFRTKRNAVADTAWALTVYSMVPYIGVLFFPFAFAVGAAELLANRRNPARGGERLALLSVGLSFLVLSIQLVLWWLLYLIPEIGI